jgi:hypothetical protein
VLYFERLTGWAAERTGKGRGPVLKDGLRAGQLARRKLKHGTVPIGGTKREIEKRFEAALLLFSVVRRFAHPLNKGVQHEPVTE